MCSDQYTPLEHKVQSHVRKLIRNPRTYINGNKYHYNKKHKNWGSENDARNTKRGSGERARGVFIKGCCPSYAKT